MQAYWEFSVPCTVEQHDILVAHLAELGFDSFVENDEGGLSAFVTEDLLNKAAAEGLVYNFYPEYSALVKWNYHAPTNWNAQWEQHFEPVFIEKELAIYAPFHDEPQGFRVKVILTPKMAFGTGHHATTRLVSKALLAMNLESKTVLDAGCGTGILGVIALKLRASLCEGYDIEEQAVENSIENAAKNNVDMPVWLGDVSSVPKGKVYDVVLANITRNVLLADMPHFSKFLKIEGSLVLSGFFEHDIPELEKAANAVGMVLQGFETENSWACMRLIKQKA